ncbi:MAG: tetratricopeptide repeat protein [Streptosporangiaceae bacterium]
METTGRTGMSSQISSRRPREAPATGSWPLQSGTVPPLADCYSPRPETGFGPMSNLVPGETAVLTRPEVIDGQSLASAGGTGKTQLAVAFAHSLWQAAATDLLVWVPAVSRDAIITGYAQALGEIGAAGLRDAQDVAAARFLSWLAETSKSWLVVLDDLADPADLAGLWPKGATGRVLITTRLQAASMRAPGRKILQVGAFSRREALGYLTAKLYNDPDQRIEALDLAEDLACLPLALTMAADTIIESGFGCRDYRIQFADRKQRINLAAADGFVATTAAAWSLALDRADQMPPAGMARPALALTAVLGPGGIPGAVLTSRAACDYITGRQRTGTAADEASARAALQSLARSGLVTIDPASSAYTVRMHHLVQATIRQVLPPVVLAQTSQTAADALVQVWPQRETNPLLAQALRECAASLHQAAAELLWEPEAHPVLLRAGRSLDSAGLTGPAISYWQMMADASGRILGPGHAQTLLSNDSLAAAYEAAGQLNEAIGVRGQNLAERERILGPGHPETLTARSNLAHVCLAAGRPPDAIPLYERTLAGREWVLGPDHPDTLTARSDLAAAYRSAGRLADAIKVFERTLADREMVLGQDHPETLTAKGNLAAVLHSAGRLPEAMPLYERTLADRERLLGEDHPDTMTARANLAYAYRTADRLKDAIPVYKRTLADRERVLGRDHLDTLTSRANLASAYQSTRRFKEAIALYEQTLADRERIQGPDHRDTVTARGNLASLYHSAGKLATAVPLYEQTLAGCERVLGAYHPDTLTSRANLAAAYHAARRLTQAIALLERTLADCERVLPPDHPLTRTVRENLDMLKRD